MKCVVAVLSVLGAGASKLRLDDARRERVSESHLDASSRSTEGLIDFLGISIEHGIKPFDGMFTKKKVLECEADGQCKDYVRKCLEHTDDIIASLGANYHEPQLKPMLERECRFGQKKIDDKYEHGFGEDEKICKDFAEMFAAAREKDLTTGDRIGYQSFCANYYGYKMGQTPPELEEAADAAKNAETTTPMPEVTETKAPGKVVQHKKPKKTKAREYTAAAVPAMNVETTSDHTTRLVVTLTIEALLIGAGAYVALKNKNNF